MIRSYIACRQFLSTIGNPPQNKDGSIPGEETDQAITKVPPTTMDLVGLAGVGSAIATMAMTAGHVVDAACFLTIGLAPYAALQKRHLKGLGGLRGQQNYLRGHVNDLTEQVSETKTSIDSLEMNVTNLETVEKELSALAEQKKTNVDRLVHIITENGRLQALIKKKLEQQITQQVVSVVTQSDADQDFCVSVEERNMLITRLNLMPGFDLDMANVEKVWPKRVVTLAEIMFVLRNLMDDSIPEKDKLFHLKPKQLLDEPTKA